MGERSIRSIAEEKNEDGLLPQTHSVWGDPTKPASNVQQVAQDPKVFAQGLLDYIRTQSDADMSPFYQIFLAGKLSNEQVALWLKQFYFDVRGFPTLMAQIVANCPYHYDVRQVYGVNVAEELGEFDPMKEHPRLLYKIGHVFGITQDEFDHVEPIPELLVYHEYRHNFVKHSSFIEGVAHGALANEGTIVARYKKIIKVLKEQYGCSDEDLEFFYIHSGGYSEIDYGGDVAHEQEAINIIERYCTTYDTQEAARLATWRSVESRKMYQWGLLRHVVLNHNDNYQKLLKEIVG
ncbi:MAG: iron-containing redox enzyme family protein [Bdellovibrionales bacterium]|nr:iron-containing redox enzyme family protein [Bdellovibrionales bacterium]